MKKKLKHLLCIFLLLSPHVHAQGNAGTYTVKPGDSFAKIARNSGCAPADLAKANGLKLDSVIHPGQKLKLPGKASTSAVPTSSTPAAASANGSHTIQAGDTLSSIARSQGVSLDSLLAANPGINPKTLKPGQKIRLVATAKAEPQPASASTHPSVAPPNAPSPAVPSVTDAEDPPQAADTVKSEGQPRTVMVDAVMTYSEFAAKYGTDIDRLNELNGLDLVPSTVLAKGSELYIPGQP